MLNNKIREKIKQKAYEIRKKKKARQYVIDYGYGDTQGMSVDPNDYDDTRNIPPGCWD